ncbi:3-hydroxyacyl-CoA dehydrogenase [Angulomicrobium tetraedrale]|uniref:3-hydroxyacyl-CoA dehydrogenase n=1 Tax=Ancylobacter tetraedralis TaxID=217068 RepID=A0A839ZA97_9HYPH|nr:3-hydroxyacyl-CoA dehydrogenase [Ancylobacter tetraedralis]MBB3771642.1 3-hydroxyacyl-CoA dehydrogenase [Ancylobacter tetraedralis]
MTRPAPDTAHPVAIVGAGLVGSGWALVFARAGLRVQVYDPVAEVRAGILPWARESASALAAVGLIEDVEAVMARLHVVDTLEAALDGATYIQESVFERVDVKSEISRAIDAVMAPNAIVGSSSSGIPASRFTQDCAHRGRFLIAHPVNPPHLVPVVELVPAPWTEAEALAGARELMQAVGQVPVTLSREIDGFILNRLQGALLNEAWALYDEGYAGLADIDATIAHGLGLRWAFMGPFETIDLNAPGGIVDYAARLGGMYHAMAQSRTPRAWPEETIRRAGEERREALPEAELAARRAWRDRALTGIAAFKKAGGLAP